MAWKNLRLFSLNSKSSFDSIMRKLEPFRFNGEEGINKFEVWKDFKELRMIYVFKIPKFVKISKFTDGILEEEKIKMETFASVEIHIKSSGLIEAYGSHVLIERAIESLSTLGDIDPVVFGQKDFRKVMKMASDVRKIRIYGSEDEHVVEVILVGGGLSASKELKRLKAKGKLREISGKLELPDDAYGFSMTEKSIKFFIKDGEKAQNDLEYFIDSLLLS